MLAPFYNCMAERLMWGRIICSIESFDPPVYGYVDDTTGTQQVVIPESHIVTIASFYIVTLHSFDPAVNRQTASAHEA